MASSPAWSIGTGKRNIRNSVMDAPGPGAYTAEVNLRQSSPSWKIGTSTKVSDVKDISPGPGAYDSSGKFSRTAPMYHFGLKTAVHEKDFTPGPGAYNQVVLKGTEMKSPAFTMRMKGLVNEQRASSPGPGAYDQTSKLLNLRSATYKIGSSKRKPLHYTEEVPGPGSYLLDVSGPRGSVTGVKFGTSTRADMNSSVTPPGPGAYNTTFSLADFKRGATMVARRPDTAIEKLARNPGPGAYEPTADVRRRAPSVRIGSAARTTYSRDGNNTPGPGNYSPSPLERRGKMRIGTSVRASLNNSAISPGPGAYDSRLDTSTGPQITIVPRRESGLIAERECSSPGPGAYTPGIEPVKKRNPKFAIGKALRSSSVLLDEAPGPGAYNLRGNLGGPLWRFGAEEKNRAGNKTAEPGPGSYNIPSKFADVPKYILGDSPKKITNSSFSK